MQLDLFPSTVTDVEADREDEVYFCRKCEQHKEPSAFNPSTLLVFRNDTKARKSGRGQAVWCKSCSKEYGIGKRVAEKQAKPKPTEPSPCDCCSKIMEPNMLYLDHDHITYKFRGWLCRSCNSGIGGLGDDIEGLKKALAYLERVK